MSGLSRRRSAGVLLHPTSLPGPHGIGDLGPHAHAFLDWLRAARVRWWQMLPIGPVGPGDCPYASQSGCAGEVRLVALAPLVAAGLLPRGALAAPRRLGRAEAQFDAALAFKEPRLADAHRRFRERGGFASAAFRRFAREARGWLPAWIEYRRGEADGLEAFVQFAFDSQWRSLRSAARAKGIRLLGDLPLFVGLDSAEVRSRPDLFRLRASGKPELLTGAPPDDFNRSGQLWGHPHYRWSAHRREGFRWWRERVAWQLRRFDALRLDHFIGLRRAWEVPGRARTARSGRWGRTPGGELLRALRRDHWRLPFVAEDLGATGRDVEALRDAFDLPGMRIVQWAFGADDVPDLPRNHPVRAVAYTGTHDNDTLAGWWRTLPAQARARALRACGSARDPVQGIIRLTLSSRAFLAVVPMQDLLGLGSDSRMNTPGTANGNWRWRLEPGEPSARRAHALARLIRNSGRSP